MFSHLLLNLHYFLILTTPKVHENLLKKCNILGGSGVLNEELIGSNAQIRIKLGSWCHVDNHVVSLSLYSALAAPM